MPFSRPDAQGAGQAVFLHAHPDDEAIFTGGTMVALAQAGIGVTLVFATAGELGGDDPQLASIRRTEAEWAAGALGVTDVRGLGFADSGMASGGSDRPSHESSAVGSGPEGFAHQNVAAAAQRLGEVLVEVEATCVVGYDETGIYGHPDHVAVCRVAHAAATLVGCSTVYEATVDREYLHFVESHLVEEAHRSSDLGLVTAALGTPSVEIDLTVDVSAHLALKRAAMAAHSSQVPAHSSAMRLARAQFGDVYGLEWYRRRGPRSVLDALPTARSGW